MSIHGLSMPNTPLSEAITVTATVTMPDGQLLQATVTPAADLSNDQQARTAAIAALQAAFRIVDKKARDWDRTPAHDSSAAQATVPITAPGTPLWGGGWSSDTSTHPVSGVARVS